jgi:hypothetical protein
MNYPTLTASLDQPAPPPSLSLALPGLWWDAKGDWENAHDCAQQREDAAGNRLHACFHRTEGDIGNAGNWYRRAGVAAARTYSSRCAMLI